MYKKSKKLIVWCLVVSMVLTQMLFTNAAFAATSAATRLAGADRYQTAIEVSKAGWTTSDNAVIAYGEDFPDALTAAPLAKKYNAPILLTEKAGLSAGVLVELQRLGVKNVFIVGGEGVVSKTVADTLTAANITVERLFGADRYATALAVANKIGTSSEVVVAYGENYPDALSISAIAAAKGMPILLTDKDAMSDAVKAFIGTKKAYVVGGEGVVSATVFNGLTGAVRLGGADRYATNVAVMSNFATDLSFAKVFVATGENFADALAGSAYAAKVGAPIVLTYTTLAEGTKAFLNGKVAAEAQVIALGGVAVVSEAAVAGVKAPVVVPTTFGVESVSTLGLNGVKVVFNQEVDKDAAVNVSNYSFDGIDLTVGQDTAILASDNKTLTIMLNDKFDQYKKSLFTIKDKQVLSKDTLNSVAKYEQELVFSDVAVPAVESVKVTGNKKITVTFAEPVKIDNAVTGTNASTLFKIDGQYLSSYGFTGATATTQTVGGGLAGYGLKLDLNFDVAIPSGVHTLKILKGSSTNFADAAGYFVAETDNSFTVESITTAPQVVSVTAETNGTVYVTYDRAMNTNADEAARYGLNGNVGAGTINSIGFKSGSGDKVVKIVYSTSITEGANFLTIDNDVIDVYGNKLHSSTDQRVTFSAVKDTTKPSVVSVAIIDRNHIRVQFSEDVNPAYAQQLSNYELKDSSGVVKTINNNIAVAVADNTFTLNTANDLTGSNYTLKIKNIVDKASPANAMDEYVATVSGRDDVAPEVSQVVQASGSKVVVYFSEAMDLATITNAANYAYLNNKTTTDTKALPSSASITAGEDNKSVTIEFPTGYSVTTVTVADNHADASNYKVRAIRVSNVKDVAGNALANVADTKYAVLAADSNVGNPEFSVNTFKLYADSTKAWAEFELDQTLSNVDKLDFYVATSVQGANPSTTPDTITISGKKLILNFTKDSGKRALVMAMGPSAKLYTIASPNSTNAAGVKLAAISGEVVYDDQIAPRWDDVVTVTTTVAQIGDIAAGTKVVKLSFSEAIDSTIAGLYKDDFTFTTDGGVLLTVTSTVVSGQDVYYSFSQAIGAAKVTVKAQSGKIDIKDVKDGGAKDQNLYVPTSGQIEGKTSN